MEIKIVSNTLKSDEIFELLNNSIEETEQIKLEKREEPEDSKALDPKIVVAIIELGGFALALFINTIVTVWATKRKDKEASIKIKYAEKDGNTLEVEFPAGLSKDEIDTYIDKVKNKTIKKIIIYEQ